MKKRWMCRLARLLALCLIVNNCIQNMPIIAYAAEDTSVTVSSGDQELVSDGSVSEAKDAELPDEQVSEDAPMLLSESNNTGATLPTTTDAYDVAVATTKTFYIKTYEQFVAMQTLCEHAGGFAGITLIIASPPDGSGTWDIAAQENFGGIGTASVPFRGTLYCDYDSGVKLQLDTPLFTYLGDGAQVNKLTVVTNAASAVIAENISGAVTVSDIVLSGAVENASGKAGIIAGNITDNSEVTLADVTVGSDGITVSGAVAGGIAGAVGNNVTVTLGDDVSFGAVTVTGTESVGGHFGTVTGSCTWNLADESKLVASVVGDADTAYAGQFAGKLLSTGEAVAQLNITGGNTVTVNVSGTGNGGGLLGLCGSNTKIVKPEGIFTVTGTVDMDGGSVGGVVGKLEAVSMGLADYTVAAETAISGKYAGGIVGEITGAKCIIADMTINGTVNGSSYTGGIVGRVVSASAVELQGTIDVLNTTINGSGKGSVVGQQDVSLIYFAGSEGKIDGVAQLQAPILEDDVLPLCLEVNTYGGIFRNQTLTSGEMLIGDGTLENVGVIYNTITKSGDWYMLGEDSTTDAAADIETLAIALYTEGNYGLVNAEGQNVFADATGWSQLLSSSYQLNNNVDISYDKTGIITIDRHDKSESEYAFSGKFAGVNQNITLTQNVKLYRYAVWNLGVFRTLGGNAEFSNLIIDGQVRLASNVGGLASTSIGTGLTLKNIQMKKEFTECGESIGGVLHSVSDSSAFTVNAENVTLASTIKAGSVNESSGFITTLKNATVSMNDIVLGGAFSCSSTSETGGFLGKDWTKVGGTIKNVTVQDGTTYTASGRFGGLLRKVTSKENARLTLDTVKLDGLTISANDDKSKCGLLVQNATNLILEVIDYDSSGCVVNNPGKYFDEIAGETKSSGLNSTGIVSIYKTTDGGTGYCFPDYYYENQVESLKTIKNPYTMYFYDVFQRLDAAKAAGETLDATLNTETEVLLWDLMHYAKEGNVWKTLNAYWSTSPYSKYSGIWWETIQFSGALDLSEISFYPVIHVGGKYDCTGLNAVITFDAAEMESWTLNNTDEDSQHFGLNAGLFYNAGTIIINYLTLTGNVANLGEDSGAIVCGDEGMSATQLRNVTLNNLWINDYTVDQSEPGAGLIISHIPATPDVEDDGTSVAYECTFRDIVMTGYGNATAEKKAAAALIGSAGSADSDNLILDFKRMIIADDSDVNPPAVSHNGDVLGYASFLYNYTYTDEASINEGYGLYLFDEDECPAGVTYGEELDADTEFADNTNKVLDTLKIDATNYKPYVFKGKDIEVNPKSGDILKGCGTYEDPYVIETAKQLLTLYRYINETGTEGAYRYQAFYEDWKIIAPGDDSTFCGTKHRVTEVSEDNYSGQGTEDVKVFPADGMISANEFPSPDDLSRAYYQLGADIDLSGIKTGTYGQIAQDFVGFGTEERPFVGVWYGKDENGNMHTITLPEKTSAATYTTYGFIQYAQGTVVKDMVLGTSKSVLESGALDTDKLATVSEAGGGVIACILGGDNIIDGVTVSVDLKASDEMDSAAIGGYVGNVKKGGLILRGVTDASLQDFAAHSDSTQHFLGAVVGKVEDGYVLYEGSEEDSVYWSGKGGNTTLEAAVSNYSILNGDKLQDDAAGLSVALTDVSDSTSDKNVTVTIPNAAALQVMSMALNADALNICPSSYVSDKSIHWGYSEMSRSRKAKYDKIGACGSDITAVPGDYIAAVSYDNVMGYTEVSTADKAYAYPYLYQYMNIKATGYTDYMNGSYSVMNPAEAINGMRYHVTWNLSEGGSFDMTGYGEAFRGIGALYQPGEGYGATFRGDFNGYGNVVVLAMNRQVFGTDKDIASVKRAGLFNVLYGRSMGPSSDKSIYNSLVDFGNMGDTAIGTVPCYMIRDLQLSGSISAECTDGSTRVTAGGVAAEIVQGNFAFENITIVDNAKFAIGESSQKYISTFGGILGNVSNGGYVMIQDCRFTGTNTPIVMKGYSHGGGFVGSAKLTLLKIADSSVDGLQLTAMKDGTGGSAGGFVGYMPKNAGTLVISGAAANNSTTNYAAVKNSTLKGLVHAGGLVGETNCNTFMEFVLSKGNDVSAYRSMGGIIGIAGENNKTSILNYIAVENITTNEHYLYNGVEGIGGVVGNNLHMMFISNATVSGDKNGTEYNSKLQGLWWKARNSGWIQGVGGIVGSHTDNVLILDTCNVTDVSITTDEQDGYDAPLAVGGIVGYNSAEILLNGSIETSGLYLEVPVLADGKEKINTAGGCFGLVRGKISGYTDTSDTAYYQGLTATDNTVTGKASGGLIGYLDGSNGEVRLHGATVSGGDIVSDEYAGGLIGYANPGYSGLAFNTPGTYSSEAEKDKNIVKDVNISGRIIGGAFGYVKISNNDMRVENITVQESVIKASGDECSVGGIVGEVNYEAWGGQYKLSLYGATLKQNTIGFLLADNKNKWEIFPEVGGVAGSVTGYSPGDFRCDDVYIAADNIMGAFSESDATIRLVKFDGSVAVLADVSLPDSAEKNYNALENLATDYGYYIGTVMGAMESTSVQFYMLRSDDATESSTIPVLSNNPPVMDVGRLGSQEDAKYYLSNVHIIYGAPVTEVTDETTGQSYQAGDASKNLTYMKARVDEANAAYNKESLTLQKLLQQYRMSEDAIALFDKGYQTSFTFQEGTGIDSPILVYKPEYGTLQEFMEAITDIMTNVAGASASDIDAGYLQISCAQKLCNGAVVESGSGTPSISVTITDGEAVYSSERYDGVTDNNQLTYTELTYVYGWEGHTKTFRLPVFVEEPVLYNVHAKLAGGKVADIEVLKASNITDETPQVIMANDSDYTMLLEYSYGKARKNMPSATVVDKVFYVTADTAKYIAEGTRLMLIDVTGGNKAYYYTVASGSQISSLHFTDFKDSAGNAYQNTYISQLADVVDDGEEYYTDLGGHRLQNVGVEQFLLVVLAADSAATTKEVYKIHAGIEIADENLASRFEVMENHKQEVAIGVTAVPGLNIAFKGKQTDTDISGSIGRDGGLTVKALVAVAAKDPLYWTEKNAPSDIDIPMIDSSNSSKYLDVAFYLRNQEGNREKFPSGTNFSYQLGDGAYSEPKVIPDDSVFYYYKGIRDAFELADSYYYVGGLTQDTDIPMEFKMDFSGADLSNISDESYYAWLELLRTGNIEYPMSNGNKLDDYSESVEASAVQQLGFAIKAQQLEDLAINTYPTAADENVIAYSVMLDFSDLLKQSGGNGTDALLERWASFNYTVRYQLYQKTENGASVAYEAYSGGDIVLTADGGVTDNGDGTYTESTATSSNGAMEVLYRFTEEELADGLVTLTENRIVLDTDQLITVPQNLTNYKIVATLTVAEPGVAVAPAKDTTDFFIYTITKLKYDL